MIPSAFLLPWRIVFAENGNVVQAGKVARYATLPPKFTRTGNLAEGNNVGKKDEDRNLIIHSQPIGLLGNLKSCGAVCPAIL